MKLLIHYQKSTGATIEVWEWISNFIPHSTEHMITYPSWYLSWPMLVKTPGHQLWGKIPAMRVKFQHVPFQCQWDTKYNFIFAFLKKSEWKIIPDSTNNSGSYSQWPVDPQPALWLWPPVDAELDESRQCPHLQHGMCISCGTGGKTAAETETEGLRLRRSVGWDGLGLPWLGSLFCWSRTVIRTDIILTHLDLD